MAKRDQSYDEYLKRASKKHQVPIEILRKILEIENEMQFMKRRRNIYSSLRSIFIDAVREGT